MASADEGDVAHRVAHALQAIRRGEADAVEIHGASIDKKVARVLVGDFVHVFGVDVVISDRPDGFRVAARNPPIRTIEIEL